MHSKLCTFTWEKGQDSLEMKAAALQETVHGLNCLFQHLKEKKALFGEDVRQDYCTAITVSSSSNKTV